MKTLWVEKYRPQTVEEYVFKDSVLRQQVTNWIEEKSIPHLLFSGSPGTGKTTLAKLLCFAMEVEEADTFYINASRENRVDDMRTKINNFSQTMPWGDFKVIILSKALIILSALIPISKFVSYKPDLMLSYFNNFN